MNLHKEHNTTWKFVHPDFSRKEGSSGLVLAASGGVGTLSGRQAIKQSLEILLSTSPGERVMRPEYGCDLRQITFLANNRTTAGLAIHLVRKAIERFEKRVAIIHIDAQANPQQAAELIIELSYRIKSSMQEDQVVIRQELNL